MYDKVSIETLVTEFGVDLFSLQTFLKPLIQRGLVLKEKSFVDTSNFGERNIRTAEFFRSFSSVENPTGDMIKKLFNSSILILGLGSVGTWATEMFARIGIRKLVLVDHDKVELPNIPRQAMFSLRDVGCKKVDVAKSYCESVCGTIEIKTFPNKITSAANLFEKLDDVNLVINCADKPDVDTTNAFVTEACFKSMVPHILCGGYDGHLSFLGQTVIPHKTSCWFCYSNSGIYEKLLDGFKIIERKSEDHVGGTICPIGIQIASFQVQEAIRVITSCSRPVMINRKAEIDFLGLSCSFTKIPKLKQCRICNQ
jgi:molybdopterin/thiamine biosynthesis adenylyltransferase